MTGADLAKLNVGGTNYVTTHDTLRESVYLTTLIDGEWDEQTSDEIFIDRDGFLFRFILLYLRTGDFEIERCYLKSLKNEADFYGIPALSNKIDKIMDTKEEVLYQLLTEEQFNSSTNHTIDPFLLPSYIGRVKAIPFQLISSISCLRKVYHCPREIFVHKESYRCGYKCNRFPVSSDYQAHTYEDVKLYLVRFNTSGDV
ncbi:hypothetical protein INT47_007978 [Mucor saturninus]|uniref:BTB domain-containing protein n=1 Tax=Mucor saturninus TaxID=64648 RepID=A0A8H7UYK9_9FUNG|nr:hypothetical protein INT47_007978 [Mucor saturninus]